MRGWGAVLAGVLACACGGDDDGDAGAVLRAESPESSQEAVRLWEHTVRLGDRSFDCLVVESRQSDGRLLKSWYCPTYPLKIVRLERDGALVEALVECGSAWASRQPPK